MKQAANVNNVMSLRSRWEKLEPQFISLYLRDRLGLESGTLQVRWLLIQDSLSKVVDLLIASREPPANSTTVSLTRVRS
jgi:hypothetical protein